MHIPDLTMESLKALHELIREALLKDDAVASDQPKPYGVREHSDWKRQSDAFEAELTARQQDFVPIAW